MITLRHGSGFDGAPRVRALVLELRERLDVAGFRPEPEGIFGEQTRSAVVAFQQAQGLSPDGVVGPRTWQALEAVSTSPRADDGGTDPAGERGILAGFRGDLAWIHAREGHAGRAYWPGGESGITLDPGFDLGRNDLETAMRFYQELLADEEAIALRGAIGLRGEPAKSLLNHSAPLLAIRITRQEALQVLPEIASPYWDAIHRRFPRLTDERTPPEVQTAMLSLAYNRGPNNPGLEPLSGAIECGRWEIVAEVVRTMQQDHPVPGIALRRRQEAELIRSGLA